ncbi:MAG: FixH family protein [Chloroflexi bacterium]|nr:FixH family protein [Chloroflexota bacterium]
MMRLCTFFVLSLALLMAACRGSAEIGAVASDVTVAVQVEPDPPAVGEATLRNYLTGVDGAPIDGATVRARGDMDHAGMTPVLGETAQSQAGVYGVPFGWSMGGGWIVDVTATLPDNRGVAQESSSSSSTPSRQTASSTAVPPPKPRRPRTVRQTRCAS